MDQRSLQDLISKLIPDEVEGLLNQGDNQAGEQQNRMVELLKTAAGQAGGDADTEISNFLNGRGTLLETTRAAATKGGSSAASIVTNFLTGQLHLSPALARIIAPLLISLVSAIGKLPGTGTAAKPKTQKKKPRPSSAKTAQHTRPRKPASSASSKPKKPKSASNKKPATKPKKRGRAQEIPLGND